MIELLSREDLTDEQYIGHLLAANGKIPHNEALAESFENDLCRWHLKIAEAFEAGMKAGRAKARDALKGEG